MFFVKCAAKGCSAKEDGFYASEKESGWHWVATPSPNTDNWWCPKHPPTLEMLSGTKISVKMDPVANNVSTLGEVWVGETMPDTAALAAMAKLQEREQERKQREADRWKVGPIGLDTVLDAIKKTDERPEIEPEEIAQAAEEFAKLFEESRGRELQHDFGFNDIEDGSEERFERRSRKIPWLQHRAWWFLHNCIAHPLIGILPRRMAFEFHDWTSRRMHGQR